MYLTKEVQAMLSTLSDEDAARVTELRLRADRRAVVHCGRRLESAGRISAKDLHAMADAMLGHALHARQEELRQGFVTLPGGYRAGLCGRAVVKEGRLYAMQDISSIAIRIAREIKGAADALMPLLLRDGYPCSALILSPPGFGKTTLLRDAARQLSEAGFSVSIVDERSELAACLYGSPSLDVGPHTDVLDGCPKAQGIRLMLRAMSPQILVTDELGGHEDAAAVAEAARCGVAVIASAHGRDFADARARQMLGKALSPAVFDRVVSLCSLGTVGAVYTGLGERIA